MRVNSGQAPSTLISKYVGSDFDKVKAVADNIEYIKEVAEVINGISVQGYIGATPPSKPKDGTEWYCTTDGRSYVGYEDHDSGQWVESSPQNAPVDAICTVMDATGCYVYMPGDDVELS